MIKGRRQQEERRMEHNRPQSLRSSWSAPRNERLWLQPFFDALWLVEKTIEYSLLSIFYCIFNQSERAKKWSQPESLVSRCWYQEKSRLLGRTERKNRTHLKDTSFGSPSAAILFWLWHETLLRMRPVFPLCPLDEIWMEQWLDHREPGFRSHTKHQSVLSFPLLRFVEQFVWVALVEVVAL